MVPVVLFSVNARKTRLFQIVVENPTFQIPQPHGVGKNSQNSKKSFIYYLVNLWLLQVFNRFIHLMDI